MYADHREDVTEVRAGDIVAALGFKDTFTGDTLCDNRMVMLENITFPEPVISVAIEPKTSCRPGPNGGGFEETLRGRSNFPSSL